MLRKKIKHKIKSISYLFFIQFFIFSMFCGVSYSVSAKKTKKRVYSVDFDDEFVEGSVKNPNIFHLFSKQEIEYDKLVVLKKNFLPEMRRTAGELE